MIPHINIFLNISLFLYSVQVIVGEAIELLRKDPKRKLDVVAQKASRLIFEHIACIHYNSSSSDKEEEEDNEENREHDHGAERKRANKEDDDKHCYYQVAKERTEEEEAEEKEEEKEEIVEDDEKEEEEYDAAIKASDPAYSSQLRH